MDENEFLDALSPAAIAEISKSDRWTEKLRLAWIRWWRWKRPHPVTRIRQDWQRSQRGWAARDLWSMDGYICELLGGMTAEMRSSAHGHPCNPAGGVCGNMPDSEPCSCEQDWNDTLDTIAEPLLNYKTHWDYPDGETTGQHVKREAKVIANAQEALRKLADVLPSLWD